jgi:hypothetical protein
MTRNAASNPRIHACTHPHPQVHGHGIHTQRRRHRHDHDIHASTHPQRFTHSSSHASIHPCIHVHPRIHSPMHASIYTFMPRRHTSIHSCTHLIMSIHLSIRHPSHRKNQIGKSSTKHSRTSHPSRLGRCDVGTRNQEPGTFMALHRSE